MAGLPRSGSTLLGALLAQNPRIHTEPASPLMELVAAINQILERNEHYRAYPKQKQLFALIRSLFPSYYGNTDRPVIVDKNRGWPIQISGLEQCVVEKAKIICPVRSIDEILASLLRIARENPWDPQSGRINFIDRHLIAANQSINDDNRCEALLDIRGLLGQSMAAIHSAIDKGFGDRLHFVEYAKLVKSPAKTLAGIYRFIGEEPYQGHVFDSIAQGERENDSEVFAVPSLHEVRPKLEKSSTDPAAVLPARYYERCQGAEFWRAGGVARNSSLIDKGRTITHNT